MDDLKIIMLKGLPASGKSSWAKEQVANGKYIRVSKDDIRADIYGGFSRSTEKSVINLRDILISEGIKSGYSVIVDDTNLNPKHEKNLRKLANNLGVGFEINDSFLEVSVDECVARDLKRDISVGPSVIYEMYDKYVSISQTKRLNREFKKRRCVIFDLDGTLAHAGRRGRLDFEKAGCDKVDLFLSAVLEGLDNTYETYLDIVIVSGREEKYREVSEKWLEKNMLPYHKLLMRKTGDSRSDDIVKEEIYHNEIEPNWCVLGVFDDRPRVARMWRRLGLNVAQMGNPYNEF